MQLLCLLHVLSLDFFVSKFIDHEIGKLTNFVSKFIDHEIGKLTNLQPFTSLSEASGNRLSNILK